MLNPSRISLNDRDEFMIQSEVLRDKNWEKQVLRISNFENALTKLLEIVLERKERGHIRNGLLNQAGLDLDFSSASYWPHGHLGKQFIFSEARSQLVLDKKPLWLN